ncbi:MAG: glycosyltransferase family 9 protein [Proteobacteria bacterium]|nr:glycosyltransferase family 9 protein [Pseudomonadota bacterium]
MKRTLFVASNRLGDAVLTTGVLRYLVNKEPESPVTVVCGNIPKDLFIDFDGVDHVIGVEKKRFSLHWPETAFSLGKFYWHRIVDFRASLLGFLPARHRHIWKGGNDHLHKVVANARLIGVDQPLPASIIPTDDQIAASRVWLGNGESSRPILAVAPTANFYQKQWHHENFLHLAQQLTGPNGILPGARVAVFGAPGEEDQALPVVEALPEDQCINLVGRTTPMEAATILSQCALFIGNDSGLMHTATAVQIPTVGLFGIGQPDVYGPWGEKSLCLTSIPPGTPITRQSGNGTEPLDPERVLREVEAFYRRIQLNKDD